ncbi:hypothetical protein N9H19_01425 [Flavobacteriales bacterium]|nr:hypothetical protein [Flavobacteriales bacterium]
MSSKIKKIKSNTIFPKARIIYVTLFLFYISCISIVFLTNGLIERFLLQNYILLSLPLVFPFLLSFLGVYCFTFQDNNGLVEINNDCMLLGKFNEGFRNQLAIPFNTITDVRLESSLFGLRKILLLKFKGNEKKYKKEFNISLLSKDETKSLLSHLLNKSTN